jgi:tripeptidyl-peptidase I
LPKCVTGSLNILFQHNIQLATKRNSYGIVEYTPQSYIPSDLDVFAKNFTPGAVGYRPKLDSIDGGEIITGPPDFSVNSESNLDLQYAIGLTFPLEITLYQVGGKPARVSPRVCPHPFMSITDPVAQASFNNFLDGIDASYCTYEGGDDPSQDGIYPDPSGYNRTFCVLETHAIAKR